MSKMSTNPLFRYDAFLLDIDGVLVRGSTPLAGAADGLRELQHRGRTILMTNNSSRSRAEHAERLTQLGFSVAAEDVLPSSYIAASYLSNRFGPVAFWVVGESGLETELRLAGHHPADSPSTADWVVAGIDWHISYETLADALRALIAGAHLLGTNADPTFPSSEGLLPGAGSILGALEGMGFKPEAVVGKPSPIAFRAALELLDANPTSVLMIGDRLETDIAGGAQAGMDTALVFTGIADRAAAAASAIRPTWTADSLADLADGNLSPPVL
jgi:4-nitrophenyl phosphatase